MKNKTVRAIALCMILLCLSALVGCGASTEKKNKVSVVCALFPPYDFLREITAGEEQIELTLLLKPGQESHDYDPSSKDILKIHECDLFVYGGGESDNWIDRVLQSVDTEYKTVISLMDTVNPLATETVEGMEHDHEEHHEETEYDEHVWTDPENAITIVKALQAALGKIDPNNAETYRTNASAYITKLQTLDAEFEQTVNTASRRTVVVADRFPLLYFCKAYDLTYYAAFSGCAASVEPSSATVQFLIDTVKKEQIPAVFQMELSAGALASTIAENTGCKVKTFYSCHNLTQQDFDNGETYLSLMQKNVDALKEVLN